MLTKNPQSCSAHVPNSQTYTVSDIAAILGIGRTTAYALAKSGLFRTVRIGSAIRISRASFERWLNEPIDDPTLFV